MEVREKKGEIKWVKIYKHIHDIERKEIWVGTRVLVFL